MKAKNASNKRKNNANGLLVLITVLIAVLVVALIVVMGLELLNSGSQSSGETTAPAFTIPTGDDQSQTDHQLGDGLTVMRIDRYAGIYMEDGSDEVVSNVMMLVLKNESAQDLRLARIAVQYEDFVAEFEVTNLPAHEQVVLLERSRREYVEETPVSIISRNVVFFQTPMSLEEDRVELSGSNGNIVVKNISDEDITGEIYIYYKNSARDLLYGGITYRTKVDGLAAGESAQVIAGHYNPDTCRIMMVTCGE